MREYAEYAVAEVKVRNSLSVDDRSFDDALFMRAVTIGVKPAIVYLEACSGIELAGLITATEEYRQMARCATALQWIQNDLASLPKDSLKNEIDTNIVLRYRRDFTCSLLSACQEIINIHDESIDEFERMAQRLLANTEGRTQQQLKTYLDYVRYMETGFGFYHTRADRYVRQAVIEDGNALRLTLTRR
jgi:hypothetical protein